MKRRTFIQSVIGFLALPFLPKSKAIFKPVSSYKGKTPTEFGTFTGKPRRYKRFEPHIKPMFVRLDAPCPLFEDLKPVELKKVKGCIILNDNFVHRFTAPE